MPGFELVPVDGGSLVQLPVGETVVGRGPLFGVNDKRVSRHHGLLENMAGQLRIKPTHLNPCFIQTSAVAPPQPLEKERWHVLRPGDIFSLLPGKYIYKVAGVQDNATLRNSQGFQETEGDGNDEEVKTSSSPEVSVTQGSTLTASLEEKERLDQTPGSASMNQPAGGVHVIDGDGGSVPLAEARKRLLPAWMTASTSDVKSPDTPKAVKRAPATKTPKQTHRATPKRVLSPPSPEDAELEEVVPTPKKRMRRIKSDEESPPQVSAVILAKAVVSDESDSMETGGEEAGGEKDSGRTVASSSKKAAKQPKQAPPPNGRRGQAEPAGVPRRTACPYGSSCYRKNPLHFKECSHPGDSDFEEEAAEDEEEDDDRPECPYGTDCYRKNPLHKKEYKHTKPPVRTSPSNDDGEEFDDDDSFINDDSEEVEEDSDYVPNYSDDGGKEDVKRLQKEAKAFLRRKK